MPGGRSVFFDADAEAVVLEYQEEFHHRTFSAAIQALIKDYGQMKRSIKAYQTELAELQKDGIK